MAKKNEKEKITYIDDGRTLADMSGITSPRMGRRLGPGPKFKDVWATYWGAVKMMFLPMLVVIGCLCLLFGIMWLIFRFL